MNYPILGWIIHSGSGLSRPHGFAGGVAEPAFERVARQSVPRPLGDDDEPLFSHHSR